METIERNKQQIGIHPTRTEAPAPSHYSVIVIGAGQVGLSIGYFLKQSGTSFLILDANKRVGDSWRNRWDSLRLFTPAKYNGLAGMPYPASPHYFPTKDEMADYLEQYAQTFQLPIRHEMPVASLTKSNGSFQVQSGPHRFTSDNVVVAMASFQKPKVPAFSQQLDPGIVQLHSSEYHNPDQLQEGNVLLVGGGNSGSEIAMELARSHKVFMSGRDTGHIPFNIHSTIAMHLFMPLVLRVLFHRIFTIRTFIGRRVRAKMLTHGGPLIRVKPKDLKAAGVQRVERVGKVVDGKPVLEDGTTLEVKNVIWCTGFHAGFDWIKLPVMGEQEPLHRAGVVDSQPGLYFAGLNFLYSLSSTMVQGAARDSRRLVNHILARRKVKG